MRAALFRCTYSVSQSYSGLSPLFINLYLGAALIQKNVVCSRHLTPNLDPSGNIGGSHEVVL